MRHRRLGCGDLHPLELREDSGEWRRKAYIEAELAELREAIDQSERGQGLSVKRLEAKLAIREQLLERLMDKERKDDRVTFEMAGLDHCAVDEAHYFKNKSIPERGLDRKA
jgi:N12 class adenine-specific DNA methylase